MFAWTRGLLARATFDNNEELTKFSETLEKVIIDTVESGFMTKDLAILVAGTNTVDRSKYLNTFEFIDKVAENLNIAIAK
jgi:isocitrate dehydrogenase